MGYHRADMTVECETLLFELNEEIIHLVSIFIALVYTTRHSTVKSIRILHIGLLSYKQYNILYTK